MPPDKKWIDFRKKSTGNHHGFFPSKKKYGFFCVQLFPEKKKKHPLMVFKINYIGISWILMGFQREF